MDLRVICVVLVSLCASCRAQSLAASPCNDAKTCRECIVLDPSCGWCTQGNFTANPRCDTLENLNMQGCTGADVTSPDSDNVPITDEPLSEAGTTTNFVQVKPQHIKLLLRPGQPTTFSFQVRQAEDYPVDLYYVMDISKSMEDDLANLKTLGELLAEEMKMITSNFRLGFGSFVDKVVMPYVSTVPAKLASPCAGCQPPFGFRNELPLDSDTTLFSTTVDNLVISGNLDAPEGGMDALMQVTVCKDAIGWRDTARHLVIFTTDASFHYAGDGKLGGIVKPNDGLCYTPVDNDRTYTMSNTLDYPSISQLNAAMRENSIIPIFAVTADQFAVYHNLTGFIEGAHAAILAGDSRNIVDIVREQYMAITSKVEVVDTAPENITVDYTAICTDGVPQPDTQICEGLSLGDTVTFEVTVTATSCGEANTGFTIRPIGFSEELRVDVEYLCSCDCEGSGVPNSSECSGGAGTLECGACKCNPGHYGRTCECSSEDIDLEDSENMCKAGNSTIICSGRGSCVCGECVCFPRPDPKKVVKGTYCECDNFSCDRHRGELCGGEENGVCVCDEASRKSKCQCKPGWSGPSCACSTRMDTCIAANGEICNGYGECQCGSCVCNSNYTGQQCEECRACPSKCKANEGCVECKAFGTGLSEEQCDRCPYSVMTVQGDLPSPNGSERCIVPDDDGCSVIFTYAQLENGTIVLYVLEEKSCPEPINPLVVIIPIVVGIILIGLLLLILWRVLIYLWDRKEYKQFEKDRANAKWEMGENPIYKPSTTIHKNPMYGK